MQVEVLPDERALAVAAADLVCDVLGANPATHIGLPTGRTPILTYDELGRRERSGDVSFSRANGYAVDEFCATGAVSGTNVDFFRRHLHMRLNALHCPDPASEDPARAIETHAHAIGAAGGLDLCILGIGRNGHIAFNEPPSSEASRARVVELTTETRRAYRAAFGGLDGVPIQGMTLGVADLLASRRILLLASGRAKAEVLGAALNGPRTPMLPASWLQAHPDLIVLCDSAAAGRLGPLSR
jgi:glucosamine-6-phosphate deaminase